MSARVCHLLAVHRLEIEDIARRAVETTGGSWEANPLKSVDVACVAQILSGDFDNTKVADVDFVAAVLAAAGQSVSSCLRPR